MDFQKSSSHCVQNSFFKTYLDFEQDLGEAFGAYLRYRIPGLYE